MDTILVPYGLSVVNKTPTRWENLIDFRTKGIELPHSSVLPFEVPITSDHEAIAMITKVTINKKRPPRKKINLRQIKIL